MSGLLGMPESDLLLIRSGRQEFIFKGDVKLIRSFVASAKFKKFFEKNGIRTESTVSIVLHWSCGGFCFGSLFSS